MFHFFSKKEKNRILSTSQAILNETIEKFNKVKTAHSIQVMNMYYFYFYSISSAFQSITTKKGKQMH